MARSIGDAELFAEEMNKASGKGFLTRLLGGTMYGKERMRAESSPGYQSTYGKGPVDKDAVTISAEDVERGGMSSLGQQMLQQIKDKAAERGVDPSAIGYKSILADRMVDNPAQDQEQFRKTVDEIASPAKLAQQLQTKGGSYSDKNFGPQAQAALGALNAQENMQHFDKFKEQVAWSKLPTDAAEQANHYYEQYNQALASGDQGAIVKSYNNMVQKYKNIDNRFGWNLSSSLGKLKPPPGPGGKGGGKPEFIAINRKTGLSTPLTGAEVMKYRFTKYNSDEYDIRENKGETPADTDAKKAAEDARKATAAKDLEKQMRDDMSFWFGNEEKVAAYQSRAADLGYNVVRVGRGQYRLSKSGDVSNIAQESSKPPVVAKKGVNPPGIAANAEETDPSKYKYKEGFKYRIKGIEYVFENGRLRKLDEGK
jgi:hypothetical protein